MVRGGRIGGTEWDKHIGLALIPLGKTPLPDQNRTEVSNGVLTTKLRRFQRDLLD